jgi:hypothetical protein
MDILQSRPIVVTPDYVHLCLIGERRLAETQFGKIQIHRNEEIRNWANKMEIVRPNEENVKAAIVTANNHYG